MKAHRSWHSTWYGEVALFLGGLRLAVPVLAFTAIALAVGTYLDSTQGASVAKRVVYGSPWFIALMLLMCVSLVFAVITRFPWQRRHVGFMIVHASLITLIVAGFWSLFGRVEGQIRLQEGGMANQIELTQHQLQLVEMQDGVPVIVDWVDPEASGDNVRLEDVGIEIVERWGNCDEESYVADGGPEPLRAIELRPAPQMPQTLWVGQSSRAGGPQVLMGLTIRVLGPEETWTPPATRGDETGKYFFMLEGQRYPLGDVGQEAFPGWRVEEVKRFKSAMVGSGGLSEGEGDNPAVDVTITDGRGTVERHTAFEKFPDMPMPAKRLEGDAVSGARLVAGGRSGESLVVGGDMNKIQVTYVGADGDVQELDQAAPLPWSFEVGGRQMTIVNQFSRAHMATRYVEAPPADEFRPAVLVKLAGVDGEPSALPWKSNLPLLESGRSRFLRYGPRIVQLPFSVRLNDFRKMDYPGTEMAMAYESDVHVAVAGQDPKPMTIYMNNPYVHGPWKVYQSGFIGDQISIFSVMKDPGLWLTYLACTTLCIGILVTFYSRAFSAGHPGIAVPFAKKERGNASSVSVRELVGGGVVDVSRSSGKARVDGSDGSDPDPERRAGDAAGHVRAATGGGTDREVEVGSESRS